jgi:hypothetical protein
MSIRKKGRAYNQGAGGNQARSRIRSLDDSSFAGLFHLKNKPAHLDISFLGLQNLKEILLKADFLFKGIG